MNDKVFALVAALGASFLTGTFTILATWFTAKQASEKEERAFFKQVLLTRGDALRTLYEDVLVVIDKLIQSCSKGSREDVEYTQRLHARLALMSNPDIRLQFESTLQSVREWAEVFRTEHPGDNGRLFTTTAREPNEKMSIEEVRSIVVMMNRSKLLELMMRDLNRIDTGIVQPKKIMRKQ